jgi:hypothetical protein
LDSDERGPAGCFLFLFVAFFTFVGIIYMALSGCSHAPENDQAKRLKERQELEKWAEILSKQKP